MARIVDRQPDLVDELNQVFGPNSPSMQPKTPEEIDALVQRARALADYFGSIQKVVEVSPSTY